MTCQYIQELIILVTTFHKFILGHKTIDDKIHFLKNILGSCIRGYNSSVDQISTNYVINDFKNLFHFILINHTIIVYIMYSAEKR